jgi:large subunit ribosomal protein L25
MNILKMEGLERSTGKKAANEIRRSGNVPCVLYGRGQDPVIFQLEKLAMRDLIYTDEMHRVSLTVGKSSFDCVVRDVDFHPISDEPIHADFLALTAGQTLKLSIPIQYTGQAAGQIAGGEMEFLINELEIQCLPKDIPEHIEVDVTAMEIGDTLHVSDLNLGDVEILTPERQSLVTISQPRVEVEETPDELLEGEAGEGEAAAEGEGSEAEATSEA